MATTDWESLYKAGDTHWDKGAPSPGLVDFLADHPDLPHAKVLVPGCGTGHDVRAWARAGHEVTGLDLAPTAIRLARERTAEGKLTAQFHLGDFLTMEPLGAYDWVFEHTLFCAIQPAQREEYLRALLRWLKPTGQFLAVHYMLREGDGPPFGCNQQDLMERFSPHFELIQGWVPRAYPNRTGLELMLWWRRKPAP